MGKKDLTMELSVVLPAYQEGENLKRILPNMASCLKEHFTSFEILVIDTMDNMDDTEEVCKSIEGGCVKYIHREETNDYGSAIRTGIKHATGEHIVFMDCDGSHSFEDIVRLANCQKETNADVVIASRYVKGGKTDNPFILRAMSRTLNWFYRLNFHIKVKDFSNSFRYYDAQKLKNISLKCNNFDIVEEILIVLDLVNPELIIKEIPIVFNKRQEGKSKRKLLKFIFSYFKSISYLKKIKRNYKKEIQ